MKEHRPRFVRLVDIPDMETPSPFSAASFAQTTGMQIERPLTSRMTVTRIDWFGEHEPSPGPRVAHRIARGRRGTHRLPQLLPE